MIYCSPYELLNPLTVLGFPLLFLNPVYWVNKLNCPSFLLILIVLYRLILFTMICGHPLFLVLLAISTMFSFLTIIQIFYRHFLSVGNRKSMTYLLIFEHLFSHNLAFLLKNFQCDHGVNFIMGRFITFVPNIALACVSLVQKLPHKMENPNAKFAQLIMSFVLFIAMPLFLLLFGLTPWKLLIFFSTFCPLNSWEISPRLIFSIEKPPLTHFWLFVLSPHLLFWNS